MIQILLLALCAFLGAHSAPAQNAMTFSKGYDYDKNKPVVKLIKEGEEHFVATGISFPSSVVYISDGPGCQVLVDTGVPTDKNAILESLKKHDVKVNEINYVVITHYHPDHMGNMNIFDNVTFVTSNKTFHSPTLGFMPATESKGPGKFPFQFRYLCPHVAFSHARGHTDDDTVVFVYNATGYGNVAITGDVFTSGDDIKTEKLWADMSISPDEQRQVRNSVLITADFVVPGHGPGFKVTADMKKDAIESAKTAFAAKKKPIAVTTAHPPAPHGIMGHIMKALGGK